MTLRVAGQYYSGRTALAEDTVALCTEAGQLSFESLAREPVPLNDIRFSERLGSIPRTLTLPDGAMFETSDNDRIDQWLTQCGQRASWRHWLERNSTAVGLALVVIALVVFVSVRWGIPAFSDYLAERFPPEVDAAIATGALEALDDGVFEPTQLSEAEQDTIRKQFRRLIPPEYGTDFQIVFRGGGWIGANAFALPDGTVVVTDEMIAMSGHADELGSVLLHEIGHVVHRHSLRQVIRHSWLAMLSLLIIGDVSSAGTLVLALPGVLVQSAYSREFETEADDYALVRMRDTGIDASHFADLMERIERCGLREAAALPECLNRAAKQGDAPKGSDGGWLKYLSTHPTNRDRNARFRAPQ